MAHKRKECDSQRYSSGLAYPCNRCGKIYKWRESLSLHKRMECGIEPRFACNICGRKFKHKHHLMKHHNSIHKYNHIHTILMIVTTNEHAMKEHETDIVKKGYNF
ncbi:zinc finger protein 35-like [Mycetomoellerius zeteki]|uniref:zinc finger protein 35-like n=1 Tax=Mycetomoellerius zeteki TaxID=64791 RepID=UPI00084E8F3E|nr:PREDICTED: zinc finger protein 35-like [Trachymyrmex zeteki]